MGQQEKLPQLDANTLLAEYDYTVRSLMTENIQYKTMVRQMQKQHALELQQLREQLTPRHEAPPAPKGPDTVEMIA